MLRSLKTFIVINLAHDEEFLHEVELFIILELKFIVIAIITIYLLTLVYISGDYTLESKFQTRCDFGEPPENCNCNRPFGVQNAMAKVVEFKSLIGSMYTYL